jgi:hypothetical protein
MVEPKIVFDENDSSASSREECDVTDEEIYTIVMNYDMRSAKKEQAASSVDSLDDCFQIVDESKVDYLGFNQQRPRSISFIQKEIKEVDIKCMDGAHVRNTIKVQQPELKDHEYELELFGEVIKDNESIYDHL